MPCSVSVEQTGHSCCAIVRVGVRWQLLSDWLHLSTLEALLLCQAFVQKTPGVPGVGCVACQASCLCGQQVTSLVCCSSIPCAYARSACLCDICMCCCGRWYGAVHQLVGSARPDRLSGFILSIFVLEHLWKVQSLFRLFLCGWCATSCLADPRPCTSALRSQPSIACSMNNT
jgi:hypothetical protein